MSTQSTPNPPHTKSVVQRHDGLRVAASPFNVIKLEIAIILIFAVVYWIAVESFTVNSVMQIVALLGYGVLAMSWVIIRTRHVASRSTSMRDECTR